MVKNFETYINEDYFSKLANRKDTGDVRKENEITEEDVRHLIRPKTEYGNFESYVNSITIRKENGKPIVDIDGCFYLRDDVEEIPFQFGTVTGYFDCSGAKLKTLEGCPNKVAGGFYCVNCSNITSLEGCPKEIGGDLSCSCCVSLTSLEGCPEKVGGDFNCSFCNEITSLEGCPKEVGYNFNCKTCGKQFTVNDIRSRCKVKKMVFV